MLKQIGGLYGIVLYNPPKKVVYKESFGIMLLFGGLSGIVRYKYLMERDYMETSGIINS
jgi:hypothetical protein